MSALLRPVEAPKEKTPRTESPTSIDDGALVRRAVDGDTWAEEALVKRHIREVARLVARLLGSRQDVDDIVQDVFLAAFERLSGLRKPAAFRGWLLRIAVNLTRKHIRRQRLLRAVGLDRSHPDATLEFLAASHLRPDVRSELASLDEVLRRLNADQRIAWILRYVEGHTVHDVSRICDCSVSTAKRRIAKAHHRVLSAIDEEVLNSAF